MSEKRRDQRNRILRNGESQRKDGRYVFKYRDINGQPQFVYSWRLEPTDRLPAGKRDGPALRELEPKIIRDLEDKISPRGGDMTVVELVQKYLRTKTGVRASTRAGYKTVLSLLEKDLFSGIRIDRVKQSDAKVWLIDLQKSGKSYSSMHWKSIIGLTRFKITPHVSRHTFCSNMAKSGMNPKTLQYLMGHSDISITMNTYTHIEFEDARDEVVRVCSEQLAAKNHIQRVRVQAIG